VGPGQGISGTCAVNILMEAIEWISDPEQWSGTGSIPIRMFEHLQMSSQALLLATLIALPVGVYVGHKRRLEFVAVTAGNLGRAIPSFGILAFAWIFTNSWPGELGFWPTFIALFFLGIPPILTNTYVGVKGVDRDTVEAARGMGMSERDVLLRLELPLSTPLIVVGLRTAAVQIVATATLGAVASWGGLGRFIVDGFAIRDQAQILGGAILVALLAVLTEILFSLLERVLAPKLSSSGRKRVVGRMADYRAQPGVVP
jgi:osmoprotectant transport system permease protein